MPKPDVPNRADLLERLRRANQAAWGWVVLQLVAVAIVGYMIDWVAVIHQPLLATLAVGVVVGPTIMSLVQLWAQAKREIGDLKEETRYGQFDKHSLRRLYQETVRVLGLPPARIPVYITADKSLIASAVHLGLAGVFKAFNGIYLNRQVLHQLEPEEVQDIMGHELGHFYRYYLVDSRFKGLTIILGAMIGILVSQFFGMASMFSFVISSACGVGFWTLAGMLWQKNGKTVEYLCDDLGAQVGGIHVSINGLLKLGVDAEMQLEIQNQAILAERDGRLSSVEVVEAIEAARPFGSISQADLTIAVERELAQRKAQAPKLSIGGFLSYAWNMERDEEVEEEMQEQASAMQILQTIPRVDWESMLSDPSRVHFAAHEIESLIQLIESQPSKTLFRLPQEVGAVVDVHPPLRKRILYLWYNREAIEREARSTGSQSRRL